MERNERKLKAACDEAIEAAANLMLRAGAPVPMILDRLLTYAGAQACAIDGSQRTADNFRTMASNIEGGAFHKITGEGGARH